MKSEDLLSELKAYIKRYVDSCVPGYLSSLDKFALQESGKPFLDLLFTSPSKAYKILLTYYKNTYTADFAMTTLFLKPIAVKLKELGLEDKLLQLIKEGRDSEFLNILTKKLRTS